MTAPPWWGVVNPGAGRTADTFERARAALAAGAIPATLHESRHAAELSEIIATGIAHGHRRFLAVGGDGTVNLVVDRLMRHAWDEPPLLGVLPGGSGCDFVRTFGIPQALETAVEHLRGDGCYRVDVGRLDGEWGSRFFLNVAEAGLGAAVVRLAERFPDRFGRLRYQAAVWPALARFRRAEIELNVDGRSVGGPAMLIIFANGQYFGGGMNVAPRASLIDGRFDVQVLQGPKRLAVVLQPRMTRGTHLSHRAVRRLEGSRFTLVTDPPWPVEADGEFLGTGPVSGTVLPGALDFKI